MNELCEGGEIGSFVGTQCITMERKSAFLVCLTPPPVGLPTKGRGRADFCRTDTKSQNDCESLRLLPSCRCCRLFGVLLLGERIQGRVQVVIWMHFCLETRQHFDFAKVSTGFEFIANLVESLSVVKYWSNWNGWKYRWRHFKDPIKVSIELEMTHKWVGSSWSGAFYSVSLVWHIRRRLLGLANKMLDTKERPRNKFWTISYQTKTFLGDQWLAGMEYKHSMQCTMGLSPCKMGNREFESDYHHRPHFLAV